ncbi:hypothetical protein [Streptacidiphilus albus]|uniref:hypothetical protein n=1 Tax=Streptacidiphilus albus TaxID=105425 RepID=UPI00054BD44C|nr:hypothetical protein [Streptacidiphilus albus]
MTQEQELTEFVHLSMPLTGFATYDLYGTGMAKLYLDTAREQLGADNLTGFLAAWKQVLADRGGPERLTPTYREVARALVYLWYTGSWPQLAPAAHSALRRPGPNAEFVASTSSYAEGLVWRSFQGHPAGAKPPGFGTWSAVPPELPSEQQLREELEAANEDPPVTPAAVYDAVGYGADLPSAGVPAHLLPGLRVSRSIPPSAVPSAAVAPAAAAPEQKQVSER